MKRRHDVHVTSLQWGMFEWTKTYKEIISIPYPSSDSSKSLISTVCYLKRNKILRYAVDL